MSSDTLRKARLAARSSMSYLRYKLGRPRPFLCSYFITFRCNLQCSICPLYSPHESARFYTDYVDSTTYELTTDEARSAIDQLDRIGVYTLAFTGGEALLRNDLEELARYARSKGIFTGLTTNGTLIDQKRAEALSCFDRITVSIDGLEETHDRIRGKGVYGKAMEGMRLLKEHSSATVGMYSVVNSLNTGEVQDLLELARKNADFIIYQAMNIVQPFFMEEEEAERVTRVLLDLKRRNPGFIHNVPEYLKQFPFYLTGGVSYDCELFDLYNAISPDGRFNGCPCHASSIGNLRHDDIRSLYEKSEGLKEGIKEQCGGCSLGCNIMVPQLFRLAPLDALRTKIGYSVFLKNRRPRRKEVRA